jgi:uncharacterized protein (TIGR02145 family)
MNYLNGSVVLQNWKGWLSFAASSPAFSGHYQIIRMHRFLSSFVFVFVLICQVAFLSSCKKDSNSPANPDLATVSTDRVEAIAVYSASVVSTVSKEGKSAVTGMGIAYGKNPNPTVVADSNIAYASFGVGTFSTQLSHLDSKTTYYVRAYATNATGTAYGNQLSFTTKEVALPTVTTTPISSITSFNASSGGTIINDGGDSITTRGLLWSTTANPTFIAGGARIQMNVSAAGKGSFVGNVDNLIPGTTFYVRAYAKNSAGYGYGNQQTFTATAYSGIYNSNLTYGTMSDIDGNTYKTIQIGTQTWMAENLKTTKYRNGDPISTDWSTSTTGAYAIYDNEPGNNTNLGKLYNWYAAVDSRNLCPVGWHVPSSAEWTILDNYLGGSPLAGVKLKSTIYSGATNESGFSGLSSGVLVNSYVFMNSANWWSSVESSSTFARSFYLSYYLGNSTGMDNLEKQYGLSVRCIKD